MVLPTQRVTLLYVDCAMRLSRKMGKWIRFNVIQITCDSGKGS